MQSSFNTDIQGLRAVAVMLVVLYHAGLDLLSGGYIGVDVFYVISGYLITGLLLKEMEADGTLRLPRFYARRVRRLLPAATLVVMATVTVAWWLYTPLEMKQFLSSAVATTLYVSNIWFAHLATDYLAADTHANPLLHTWSLAVEEQFYLFWPLLILFLARVVRWGSLRFRIQIGVGVILACSFVASVLLTHHSQPWAFFGSPTRAWELGLGGLIAALAPRLRTWGLGDGHALLLSWSGLGLILAGGFLLDDHSHFPGFAALLPAGGAGLILTAAASARSGWSNPILRPRSLQFIGDISYSFYLWHWPVFVFLALLLGELDWLASALGVALSLLLASLTFFLVENPIRLSPTLSRRVGLSLVLGVLLTGGSAGIALMLRAVSAQELATGMQARYQAARAEIPRVYADGCHVDFLTTQPPACVYGAPDADFTLVLFGDSIAAQWFPALEKLALRQGWRLLSMTKSGCPSVALEPFNTSFNRPYRECSEWREQVFHRIAELRPDLVILSNLTGHRVKQAGTWLTARENLQAWELGLEMTLRRLSGSGAAIALLRATPYLGVDAVTCLARADWQGQDPDQVCARPLEQAQTTQADQIFALEQRLIADLDNARTIDLTERICPRGMCRAAAGDMVIYHDKSHLTTRFVETLAEELLMRLKPVLGSVSKK